MTATAIVKDYRPGVGPHTMRRRRDESEGAWSYRVWWANHYLLTASRAALDTYPDRELACLIRAARHLGIAGGSERAARLRSLGNAVVPACAEVIGSIVIEMAGAP